jgi:BASS family bile acid:Na+ symporter
MMVAIGLGVTFAELASVARKGGLVTRAVLANYVAVPAAALGLLLLFRAKPEPAAGFLILAVCPGAPYGPPFTSLARGNMVVAVGLMVILAASSALLAPLLLSVLLPHITEAEGQSLQVDAVKLVATLLLAQLLPLVIGLAVRQWRPLLAERLKKPAHLLSTVLNAALLGTILIVQFEMLIGIPIPAFVGMFCLVATTLVIGWVLGEPGGTNRTTMAFTTAVRNAGVALVIASSSFPGKPAVTAATAYGLFQTVGLALVALTWGRLASAPARAGQPREAPKPVTKGAVS